ncbi:branched-chain amino acid ABC transporter substrate-binding protein [Dongia sedimenti]|uniref:Branched-chain amino acid ABC transporter substrate-binding protein n=1 Tax=Dongia sedimenti TaxID=3064282 RepID=A0ABU0YKL0_9PROT|nr:branched-chain amino acid ABC transporter substrate-binding protein [Rhodospirillaceae bacterium R-7]
MLTRTRTFAVATLATAAMLAACAAQKTPINPNEIVIGVAGPMTGDLAVFGEQERRGAEMAVKDINAKGGVLGKTLRLAIGDDQCDPAKAVRAANALVNQGAVFVDGHFCSGSSIPASAVYAEAGVLQITPSSTNPALTDDAAAKGIKTVMRVGNRDDQQGVFAGRWLAKAYAGRKLAVLDDGSAYGRGVADRTASVATGAGLSPALRASFPGRSKDFQSVIGKLQAAGIDVVYVGAYHDEVAPLMRQARTQGLKAEFVSVDAMNTGEFWSLAGPAGEGLRFSDAPSLIGRPSAEEAVARFRRDHYEPEGYTLNAYAAVQAFAAAASATGSTDGRKLGEWLRNNQVPTVMGTLAWDAKGDLVQQNFTWYVWKDGTYTEAPE